MITSKSQLFLVDINEILSLLFLRFFFLEKDPNADEFQMKSQHLKLWSDFSKITKRDLKTQTIILRSITMTVIIELLSTIVCQQLTH